jgi:hypothetical protein
VSADPYLRALDDLQVRLLFHDELSLVAEYIQVFGRENGLMTRLRDLDDLVNQQLEEG